MVHPARRHPLAAPATVREMVPVDDDGALVRRALGGDRWAEEALYRRHVRRVGDVAARVLGRTAEAEDVVQDTFLKALTRLDSLRDPALFERWLMRIAMNMVRGKLRKRKVMRALGLDRSVDDATFERMASPSTPSDVRAELATIDQALREVPSANRMAWMLNVVEGFTLPEVAEACDCSLATVKRRIKATREHLEAHVADHGLLEPPQLEPGEGAR